MKLFSVRGSLDKNGFSHRMQEMNVVEKKSSFVGEGKRIAKSKLLKIDTIFYETHKTLIYYTYCVDGDQQKALDTIKAHLIKKCNQYLSEITEIAKHLPK